MYIKLNLNPKAWNRVGDCVIRAIAKTLGMTWDHVYDDLCKYGKMMRDMPSSNAVFGAYLYDKGFNRYSIPNTCPDCYTIRDFCTDHPYGKYIVATGSHVVAVENGDFFDSWDSGSEVPIYYFSRESEV